jgi:hypothetical protein
VVRFLEAAGPSAGDAFATSTLPSPERIRTTLNFYDYAGQDPINGYDLDGLCGLVCVLTAGATDTLEIPGLDIVSGGVLLGVGAYECYRHCGSILHASKRKDEHARDERGNIIAGTGPGKGPALSDAESDALKDPSGADPATLRTAKQKIKTQEKYAKLRNKRKRGP